MVFTVEWKNSSNYVIDSCSIGTYSYIICMWASFFLFPSNSHQFFNSGHSRIPSTLSLLSLSMLCGKDWMPSHRSKMNWRIEVRSPKYSGSEVMPMHCLKHSVWREDMTLIVSGVLVRSLQFHISNVRRPGRWWSKLQSPRDTLQFSTTSWVTRAEAMEVLEDASTPVACSPTSAVLGNEDIRSGRTFNRCGGIF